MLKTQKYRMLATDLDETLLNPESVLSEYAAGVLRAIEEKGVKVVICTGRAYVSSLLYLRQIGLNNPGIFCNGAQIRVALDGDVIHECPLPIEEAKLGIRLGEETGGHPRVYMNDRIYISHMVEEDKVFSERTNTQFEVAGDLCALLDSLPADMPNMVPLKVLHYVRDPELVPILVEKSKRVFQNRVYITQSVSINRTMLVEYMDASVSKGNGVKKLADMWGISRDEIVAAVDHINDLSMFAEAGLSIAPQNAHSSVREAASAVCLSNSEDGVPKKLAEIFL